MCFPSQKFPWFLEESVAEVMERLCLFVHLRCAAVSHCCSCFLAAQPGALCVAQPLFPKGYAPKLSGHRGSPSLSVFHVVQGVATKRKSQAVIFSAQECTSGVRWKRERTRYHSWQSGIRDSRPGLRTMRSKYPSCNSNKDCFDES